MNRPLSADQLRACVEQQLHEFLLAGWVLPAGAALRVNRYTGRITGYLRPEDQREAAIEAARAGLDVRELRADGTERHVVEGYAIGGRS